MHTDVHIATGYTHPRKGQACQDYAEASPLPGGGAYAIVSDGCSGGGRTDFGARLLTRATAEAMKNHWAACQNPDPETAITEIATEQRARFVASAVPLGLTTYDLLATCVYAYLGPQGGYAYVAGDGLVAQLLTNGNIVVDKFDWKNNMPCYPAYADDNFAGFIREHGNNLKAPALTAARWYIVPRLEKKPLCRLLDTRQLPLDEGIRGQFVTLGKENVKAVAVLTDGVCQVDGVSWPEVVARLLAFKSLAGQFAVRRLNRFLEEVREHGKGPFDDLSYAVILTEQEAHE